MPHVDRKRPISGRSSPHASLLSSIWWSLVKIVSGMFIEMSQSFPVLLYSLKPLLDSVLNMTFDKNRRISP